MSLNLLNQSEKEKVDKSHAPHSSTLAWKVPWTEEPGGLQSVGSQSRTRLSSFTHSLIHRMFYEEDRGDITKKGI